MEGFRQINSSHFWNLNHKTVMIEPWGMDSLRIRSTMNVSIRDKLIGALITGNRLREKPPKDCISSIEINEERASIRNGKIRAEICLEGGKRQFSNFFSGGRKCISIEWGEVGRCRCPHR